MNADYQELQQSISVCLVHAKSNQVCYYYPTLKNTNARVKKSQVGGL